eukprot:INCI5097.2.p1 GENE.INCI5097.2~~INCI5097.2.p1  ORF type:complete len:831 (-),score=176.35 INCI5097.2:840-3332(-)
MSIWPLTNPLTHELTNPRTHELTNPRGCGLSLDLRACVPACVVGCGWVGLVAVGGFPGFVSCGQQPPDSSHCSCVPLRRYMGASASVVGLDAGGDVSSGSASSSSSSAAAAAAAAATAAASQRAGGAGAGVSPLLIFTHIDFENSWQMQHHTNLMARALDAHLKSNEDIFQHQQQQQQQQEQQQQEPQANGGGERKNLRYDKVFALEQTGHAQSTLIEVAVPSQLWAGAMPSAHDPNNAPREEKVSDPDENVTVGGIPGNISCRSWVGADGPIPDYALEALKQRGVVPAEKLAGFCYGTSFKHCDLFIFHQLVWKPKNVEQTLKKYTSLVKDWATSTPCKNNSMFVLFRLPPSLHCRGTVTTALLELTSKNNFEKARTSAKFFAAAQSISSLVEQHCNTDLSSTWIHFNPRPREGALPEDLRKHQKATDNAVVFLKQELKKDNYLPSHATVYHSSTLTKLGLFEDAPVISSFFRNQLGTGAAAALNPDDSSSEDSSEPPDSDLESENEDHERAAGRSGGASKSTGSLGFTQMLTGDDSDSDSDNDSKSSDDDDGMLSDSMFMSTMPAATQQKKGRRGSRNSLEGKTTLAPVKESKEAGALPSRNSKHGEEKESAERNSFARSSKLGHESSSVPASGRSRVQSGGRLAAVAEKDRAVMEQLRANLTAKAGDDLVAKLTRSASAGPARDRGGHRDDDDDDGTRGARIEKDTFLRTMSAEDLGFELDELRELADALESEERDGKIPVARIKDFLHGTPDDDDPFLSMGTSDGPSEEVGKPASRAAMAATSPTGLQVLHHKLASAVFRRYGKMKKVRCCCAGLLCCVAAVPFAR